MSNTKGTSSAIQTLMPKLKELRDQVQSRFAEIVTRKRRAGVALAELNNRPVCKSDLISLAQAIVDETADNAIKSMAVSFRGRFMATAHSGPQAKPLTVGDPQMDSTYLHYAISGSGPSLNAFSMQCALHRDATKQLVAAVIGAVDWPFETNSISLKDAGELRMRLKEQLEAIVAEERAVRADASELDLALD